MISVDGYGVDHETIRGVGTFRRTMDGVACAKAGGLFVRVNSVVHRDNMAGMLRLLEETCGMRVDVHSFFYYTPHGRGVHTTLKEVPGPIWLAFLESLKHHWTKIGVPVGTQVVAEQAFVAQNAWNPMLHGCKIASPDYAQIMCDGRVVPCTMFIVTPYSLGNVRQHSLEEVWSSQEHWKTFESIRTAGHGDSAAFEPTGCWAYLAGQNRPAARDPRWQIAQGTVPICPIVKCNVILGTTGPSTEDVISRSANRSEGPSGKS
jgi:radical SAM protein with 4Fe4S-binding SPASM domain